MPHYPKPFFRKSRQLWYVQLGGQINLGPDREVAFQAYHNLMAAGPKAVPVAVAPATAGVLVCVLCDKFLDWVQLHRSAGTYQWYWWRLQSFVKRYPKLSIDELKPFHVQEWVDAQDIAPTTQRNCIRAVKRSIKWAHRQGYILNNPLLELEAPSAERREVLIRDDEYAELLAAIRDPGFHDLVVTTWETGCRPQESLRVEARHLDLKHQRWVFSKSESKNKRTARVVYLTDEALAISRRLMVVRPDGRLFRNSRGEPWTNYAIQCAFRRVRARIGKTKLRERAISLTSPKRSVNPLAKKLERQNGLERTTASRAANRKLLERQAIAIAPRYSLYAMRHAWATRALEQGLDALTVSILLGHKDPGMLATVYQHLTLNPGHLLSELKRIAN